MEKNTRNKPPRPKRGNDQKRGTPGASMAKRDSLTRTKDILNAALRVWELKRRTGPKQSA
ncbi:MAG: hypothetical protein M3032_11615 [Verrucomicrobiota bacterium]|nr:hypothetical protein [Verrucomicrobiota bacterium]